MMRPLGTTLAALRRVLRPSATALACTSSVVARGAAFPAARTSPALPAPGGVELPKPTGAYCLAALRSRHQPRHGTGASAPSPGRRLPIAPAPSRVVAPLVGAPHAVLCPLEMAAASSLQDSGRHFRPVPAEHPERGEPPAPFQLRVLLVLTRARPAEDERVDACLLALIHAPPPEGRSRL